MVVNRCSLSLSLLIVVAERLTVAFDAESERNVTSPHGGHQTVTQSVSVSSGKREISSPASDSSTDKRISQTPELYEDLDNIRTHAAAVHTSSKSVGSPVGPQGAAGQLKTTCSVPQQQSNENNSTSSSSVVSGGHVDDQSDSTYDEIPSSVQPQRQPDGKMSSTDATDPGTGTPEDDKAAPQPTSRATEGKGDDQNVEDPSNSHPSVPQANSAGRQGHGGTARQNSVVTRSTRGQDAPPSKRESLPGLDLPSVVISEPELYVAVWDCAAAADNELTFDKGERLLIVSRQYEHLGWLVAQKTGGHRGWRTGLVPKVT